MRDIRESSRFRRDLRRMRRRGKDLSKLQAVVEMLARGEELTPTRHKPHPLIVDWRPFQDCHIEPDWLLIYRVQEEFVELYRTGSHADLFEQRTAIQDFTFQRLKAISWPHPQAPLRRLCAR